MNRRSMLSLPFVAAAPVLATACAQRQSEQTPASASVRVQRRLLAPCCWNQTLDIHESELATALRAEISDRVRRGESADAVERDMVERYGERVRAAPRARDPLAGIAVAVAAGSALIGAVLLARGRKIAASQPQVEGTVDARAESYDERIERELRELDD
jgi:cytochrome c-type biogenesis protein CcmH